MLHSKILSLQQENSRFTLGNFILNAFFLEICKEIDDEDDTFIKSTKRTLLHLLKNHTVGYSEELKQALDKYNEAVIYLVFRKKGLSIERVPESSNGGRQTPDFKLDVDGETFFIEVKTLGFANGTLNYRKAVDEELDARISIEEQIKLGKTVAIAETSFDPLQKDEQNYF